MVLFYLDRNQATESLMTNGKIELPSMEVQHRKRLEQIRNDAISLAGTAAKISQAMTQALEQGGTVNVQPQMNFVTGAVARLMKDIGVVEHLQSLGAKQKKPPAVSR